jgi:small subunit ribosomal protein S11
MAPTSSKKTKKHIKLPKARVYIHTSFNNTIITITDLNGNAYGFASAGTCGYKGTRKATPYAATVTANAIIDKLKNFGTNEIEIYISGVGVGRDTALRAFANSGLTIAAIKDRTPIAFNGPRPKKPRRV